jgi:agarase
MKKLITLIAGLFFAVGLFAQDWDGIPVPANPGEGKEWELQEEVSDDFNYTFNPTSAVATIGGKWTNFYHNNWQGPKPTVWQRDHVYVEDGKFKVKASRGPVVTFNYNGKSYTMPASYLGCATSTNRVVYPVYVETRVKIMKSVLASDVWMLSPDDTQEIDICEAYGGDRWTNEWFSNKRIHLSHHVFIRNPFQDWQPSDEGSFYTDGKTIWSDDYHRIGVYWIDPWNLEYYVDGKLVRKRSGKAQIDPKNFTNEKGLHKPMDIIINTEDQTWRAAQGLTPTDREMADAEANTFQVDWVRVYKPVAISTGLNEIQNDKQLKVYPNPIENTFQVDSGNQVIKRIVLAQLDGKIALDFDVNASNKKISTSGMDSGVYLLKVELENGKWESQKIVKL